MNRIQETLINLISISIGCKDHISIDLKTEEWIQLFDDAKAHEVNLIIYSVAKKYIGATKENTDLFNRWKSITTISMLFLQKKLLIMKDILNAFQKENIPIIVLKGLYVRNLYPQPALRTMGDVDLFVKNGDLPAAVKIISSFGYKQEMGNGSMLHINFSHEKYISIELHYSLVIINRRRLAASINTDIWKSVQYYKNDDSSYLIPSDFNHILYCCIHMTNHFGKGGFGLRQLIDFYFLVNKVKNSIDFNALIVKANTYGIGKFVEAMLYICYKLFKLEIDDSIIRKYKNDETYINIFIDEILASGVFGGKSVELSNSKALASYIGCNVNNISIFNIRYFFPKKDQLSIKYAYAKKNKVLLPIAWVHRLINNVISPKMSLSQKIPNTRIIERHLKLKNWLDIC